MTQIDDGWLCDAGSATLSAGWEYDAPWLKANHGHSHLFIARKEDRDGGVTTAQILESLGAMPPEDVLRQVFYGDPLRTPTEMIGLSALYGTRDLTEAQSAANVFDAGSRAKRRASAWLVGWGPKTVFMATPDLIPLRPSDPFESAVIVRDWRYVARGANIDVMQTVDLPVLLCHMLFAMPTLKGTKDATLRPMFYVNSDLRARLRDHGMVKDEFCDIPIRTVDELRNDEPYVA